MVTSILSASTNQYPLVADGSFVQRDLLILSGPRAFIARGREIRYGKRAAGATKSQARRSSTLCRSAAT